MTNLNKTYIKNQITKNTVIKLIIILVNILLLSLCIWQVKRGLDKEDLLKLQQINHSLYINSNYFDKINLLSHQLNIKDILYKRIQVNGNYIAPTFYLYRQHNYKSGYWV